MTDYAHQFQFFNRLLKSSHWLSWQEPLWKLFKKEQTQKNIRVYVHSLQTKFKNCMIWEVVEIRKHYYAVVTEGNSWSLVCDDKIISSFPTEAPVATLHLCFLNGFHVYIGDKKGNFLYFSFSMNLQLKFSLNFASEAGNESLHKIIPIYDEDSHYPSYLWGVYDKKILLLTFSEVENSFKSIIHYTVPPKSKLLFAEVSPQKLVLLF
jgi:hypothetical protein